ncbi:glycosyltransferase family 4 protein [Bdellovibrio bacteriovorus]
MKILVLSQYFMPETFIINELVLEMELLGHEVTVLTGKPNYPDGKVFPGYKVKGIQTEKFGKNINIFRVPLRPRGRGGAVNLALNYISFVASATILGPWILRKNKFDVIFVFAPSPITQTIPAIFLKFFKRAKLVLWVQDLWPESLVATKFVKNKSILKAVEYLVKWIYAGCDLLLVQSRAFIPPIRKIGTSTAIEYYPNSFRRLQDNKGPVLSDNISNLLENNFCALFAGNIGKAQSVETIVNAAKLLTDLNNFKIVFVGSGSMLDWIQNEIKTYGLTNVECLGRFDISFMPPMYAKAKVLLLTLNSDEILTYTLPWKTQSYMAAKKPIVAAINGEGANIIKDAQCGFAGPAEDAKELARNLRAAYEMESAQLSAMGEKGFTYFEKHFEMKSQTERLMSLFSSLN